MKKKQIIIAAAVLVLLMIGVVAAAFLLNGGGEKLPNLPDTSEEVLLGSAYEIATSLTAQDGTVYAVEQAQVYRNSNGKDVLQIYGVFDVDDILGYKIVYTAVKGEERVTQTHNLVVVDEGKPVMFVNGNYVAELGEKYIFPSVTVKDNSKAEIPCTIEVYKSAQTPVRMEQDADGFIPDEVGYYELHLSAEDSSGNQASAVFSLYARHTRLKTEIDAFDDEGLYYTAHAISGTNKVDAEFSAFSRLTSSKGSAYFRSGSGDETFFYMKPRNEASVMELVGDDGYISVWMYIATMRDSSKTVKYGNTSLALDTNVWQEIRITPEIVGPWPAYFAKLTSASLPLLSVVNDGEDYTVFIDDVFAVKNNAVAVDGLAENKTYSAGDQISVSAVDGAVCEYYHAGNAEAFTDSFVPKSEGKYMITVYSSDRTALSAEQITVGTLESQVKTTEWYMKDVQFQVPELNIYDGNRKIEAQTATWLVDIASGERTELEDSFMAQTDIVGLYSESVFDGRTTALFRIISMNDTDFDTWYETDDPQAAQMTNKWDNLQVTWLEEYDGEKGVVAIANTTGKEGYFTNRNFWKIPYSKEHYKRFSKLVFKMKAEGENVRLAYIAEPTWTSMSVTNDAENGWQEYSVDFEKIYEHFDEFNRQYIFWTDSSKQTPYTLYISDVYAVIEDEVDAVTIPAGQSYNIAEHPSFDGCEITECTVTKGGSYVAVSGTTFRTGSSGMYKVTVCGYDHMGLYFESTFVVDAVSADIWNDFNDPAVAEVPVSQDTVLSWLESYDGAEGVLKIEKGSTLEQYVGNSNGINWPAAFEKAHYANAIGLRFRVKLVSAQSAQVVAIGKNWKTAGQSLLTAGMKANVGWQEILIPYDVDADYDALNGLFFYLSSKGKFTVYIDEITMISSSNTQEPDNMWHSFSTPFSASVYVGDDSSLEWLESYDGKDGVLKIKKGATLEQYIGNTDGANWEAAFDKAHYKGAVGLSFRVKLESELTSQNIVVLGRNYKLAGQSFLTNGIKANAGWQDIVLTYDVYENYDLLNGLFFYTSSNGAFTLYIDQITAVYESNVQEPDNMWHSFSDQRSAQIYTSAESNVSWLESYDGEDGVLKIEKGETLEQYIGNTDGINWKAAFDKEHYQNAAALSFRIQLVSELSSQNIVVLGQNFGLSGQSFLTYGMRPNSGWQDIVIPYDVYENYDLLNGLFFYMSANGAFTLYIDEITAVYDTEPEQPENPTEPPIDEPDGMWYSFSDEADATSIWVNSDRASLTWHESYDGEDGVLQIDKTAAKTESYVGSTNGTNWKAAFDQAHYEGAIGLSFRVKLVADKGTNVVAYGKNGSPEIDSLLNHGLTINGGWQDIVLPIDVYENYDALCGMYFYTSSSGAYSLYIDEITAVYETEEPPTEPTEPSEEPTDPPEEPAEPDGMWYSFSDEASSTAIWIPSGVSLTWHEAYDGKDGVLQIDKTATEVERYIGKTDGENWKAVFDKAHYEGAVGLSFRVKLVSEKRTNIMAIGRNWGTSGQALINNAGDSGWRDVMLSFDVYENYDVLNGLFFYTSSSGSWTLYLDQITAVYNHTVKFSDGVEEQTVMTGGLATEPVPVKEGYRFLGWYDGETLFDFSAPITSDVFLTAKWTQSADKMWYSFGDASCASVWSSGNVVPTWLESYDGEDGVLRIDKTSDATEGYLGVTDGINWQAVHEQAYYRDAVGLSFRVKVVKDDRSAQVVVVGRNWGLPSQSFLDYSLTADGTWQDIVIPYDVYTNYDALNGMFFYLASGGAFTLYIDEITVVEKEEKLWYGFDDASCTGVWKSDGVTLTWLESYDGETGVLQVNKPSTHTERYLCKIEGGQNFTPQLAQSDCEGATALCFRVKLVSAQSANIVVYGKNWKPGGQSMLNYGLVRNGGWQDIVIPYDVYTNYEALSDLFFYMSSSGEFTLYISQITAV